MINSGTQRPKSRAGAIPGHFVPIDTSNPSVLMIEASREILYLIRLLFQIAVSI